MKDKLLIINRPINGMNDGPEIILKSILQVCNIDDYDICCDFKIINSSIKWEEKINASNI